MDAGQSSQASRPVHQGNGQPGSVAMATDESIVEVDTSHFPYILQHFNHDGKLINEKTRLSIPCNICQVRNLCLINPHFDKQDSIAYESYVVLRRCGHAFGLECISRVSNLLMDRESFCPAMHRIMLTPSR
jgi:hypothetical protein